MVDYITSIGILALAMIIVYLVCSIIHDYLEDRRDMKRLAYFEYMTPRVGKEIQQLSEETVDHIVKRTYEQSKRMMEDLAKEE